jgi:hypothetical protein
MVAGAWSLEHGVPGAWRTWSMEDLEHGGPGAWSLAHGGPGAWSLEQGRCLGRVSSILTIQVPAQKYFSQVNCGYPTTNVGEELNVER